MTELENNKQHLSVLLEESMNALNIQQSGYYIDGTFGRGGHSRAILDRLGNNGKLLVVDKDPDAIEFAQQNYKDDHRVHIKHGSFTSLKNFTEEIGCFGHVNGILLDLGVSSPQLDRAHRGFSFRENGPLDMRMDTSSGQTAAQWLAQASEQKIASVLKEFGEERFSKRIAHAIVTEREKNAITTTLQLSKIVAAANPKWEKTKDPATRSFQAIRIYINNELEDLTLTLKYLFEILAPNGRLVILSFHSLEDRIVKRFFNKLSKGDDYPKNFPVTASQLNPKIILIGKAVKATKKELQENIRSRSAVMRVAEKIA